MPEMEKHNEQHGELDWLAFCYLANELTGEQLSQFESRLAEDQAAREAVLRAMDLATDIYHADVEPLVASKTAVRRPESRRNWVWQTAVAVLIGTSLGAWLWTTSGEGKSKLTENPGEDLAVAWVESLEETELETMEFETGDEFGFDDDSTQEWMLAALGELGESELEATN